MVSLKSPTTSLLRSPKERGVLATYRSGLSSSESLALCTLAPLLSDCDSACLPPSATRTEQSAVTLSAFLLLAPDSVPAAWRVIAECVDKWAHNSRSQGITARCVLVSCSSRKELSFMLFVSAGTSKDARLQKPEDAPNSALILILAIRFPVIVCVYPKVQCPPMVTSCTL